VPGGTFLSVIVPVRDGELQLPALFDSLDAQTLPRERFEVIVVDNASTDRSAEVAERWGAVVCREPRPGRARARNTAIRQARGERLAFIDADCVAEPGWLRALDDCLDHTSLTAGPVLVTIGKAPTRLEHLDALWRFRGQERYAKEEGWSVTANLGMSRDAFEGIGGFDESYRHIGEDLDLCMRAGAAGHRMVWCPGARVEHPAERSLRAFLARAAEHGYSEQQVALIHGRMGGGQWRHPGPLLRGDWALRRFGVDPAEIDPAERRPLLWLARLEYAARMGGSLWASLRLRGIVAARRAG